MPIDNPETFGAALRFYRERAGLTQEALAEHAGLTRNAISALERGERRRPFPHTLHALAVALGLQADERAHLIALARARDQAPPPGEAAPDLTSPARPAVAGPRPAPQRPLPLPPNALIGRERELGAVLAALAEPHCRLITLAGPGGAGKSRLALQAAADTSGRFRDGAAWVALASLSEAGQVAGAIADAVGLPLQGARPPADQLCDALQDQELLLVLDTMEHLMEATGLLASILSMAPGVCVLVTSRERLRLAGEWVFDLAGLPVPALAAPEAGDSAALQLFVERARQARHDIALTAADRVAAAQVCRLVDGLPLAIELAAAWVAVLSPVEIAAELMRNLDLLSRAAPATPPRHRSLRAVFDHSWGLLRPEEQQAFARLSVFRGGWDRAAAHDLAGASLQLLAALVDKSLLQRSERPGEAARYDMHELLRQYARERLDSDPAAAFATHARHGEFYARRVGERTLALQSRAAYQAWAELAPDLDNIRAAWAWAVQRRDHQALARMGQSIQIICESQGLFEEGVSLFSAATAALREALAALPAGEPAPELVWALGHFLSLYGNRAARSGQYRLARDLLAESHALLQARSDLLVRSGTLFFLGYTTYVLGAFEDARRWLTQGIELSQAHDESFFLASSEALLAMTALAQGHDDALAIARQAVARWRENGHPRGQALGYWALSSVLRAHGEQSAAEEAAHTGLALATAVRDPWTTGALVLSLAGLALDRNELAEAQAWTEESARIFRRLGDPWSLARAQYGLGLIAHAQGRVEEARAHFEETRQLGQAHDLEDSVLDARLGLALLQAAHDPASSQAVLAEILSHPALRRSTRDRALTLQRALAEHQPPQA